MNINGLAKYPTPSPPFTKGAEAGRMYADVQLRYPVLHNLPDVWRNHFVAMCGEYVGTVLFLYFALAGTQVANNINSSPGQPGGSNAQQLQYIALSFGFSLAVNAWVFYRISGGLFNPAVTLGMCIIGALTWSRGVLLFFVQILGGMTAAALVKCMFPGPLNVQTNLNGNTTITQGLFVEMFLTAELVFTIFMLAAEKHKSTFIAPVGIGLSLFVAELTGVYFTGGSLNPARSFGPAVANHSFAGYHWIYWVGPMLGSIVAAGFYKFIKMLEYETANPDQDATRAEMLAQAQVIEHQRAQSLGGNTIMAPVDSRASGAAPGTENWHKTSSRPDTGAGSGSVYDRSSYASGGVQATSVFGGRLVDEEAESIDIRARTESPVMSIHDVLRDPGYGGRGGNENVKYPQAGGEQSRFRPSRTGSSGV